MTSLSTLANTGHVWNHCVLRCWIFCELFIRGTSRSENAVQDVEMLAMISGPPSAEKGDSFQPKAQYSLTQIQFLFPWHSSSALSHHWVSSQSCAHLQLWFITVFLPFDRHAETPNSKQSHGDRAWTTRWNPSWNNNGLRQHGYGFSFVLPLWGKSLLWCATSLD